MKKSFILAFLIAAAAVVWVASGVFAPAPTDTTAAQSPAEAAAPQVRVRDSVAEDMTAHITVTGRTVARRRIELKAEIAGQVTEIVVEKGARVEAGAVIAKLDERDRRARLAEAKERVNQRQIEFNAARELEEKGFNSRVRLAQSRADLESARAELRRAEIELANTAITAPFSGIVAAQMIEKGDFVDIGTVAFVMVDLDPIRLSGFVTEKQISALSAGANVSARLLDGREVAGVLTYVAPVADPATRTFAFEAEVPNPDHSVVEGMTASVRIPLAARKAHRISPAVLGLDDTGRVGVKLVDADNRVDFVPIVIITDEPTHMWVGGLPDRARLITVGQEFVTPGQIVTPVAADEGGAL